MLIKWNKFTIEYYFNKFNIRILVYYGDTLLIKRLKTIKKITKGQ